MNFGCRAEDLFIPKELVSFGRLQRNEIRSEMAEGSALSRQR